MTVPRPAYIKYSTDELMEVISVFNVDDHSRAQIESILRSAKPVPDACNFFRYYNPRSKTAAFEKAYAEKVGSRYALAVNSGTSALIASCIAAGIAPGDEVIVPGYTFFASASAVVVARGLVRPSRQARGSGEIVIENHTA